MREKPWYYSHMAHDVYRQWAILRLLPRWPNVLTVTVLTENLVAEGHDSATEQLVRRDLERMSLTFPIDCRKKMRPHGWGWAKDAPEFDVPAMTKALAMLLRIAEEQVGPVLPPMLRKGLEFTMSHARRLLAALSPSPAADFPSKIRIVPNGPPMRARPVPTEILSAVSDALHRGRKLQARYARRNETEARPYVLDPLGLLIRGPQFVLVAAEPDRKPRTYLLHRFAEVRVDETPLEIPPGFDLDAWIADGGLAFSYSKDPVQLVALFDSKFAPEVHELELSKDQTVEAEEGGTLRVTATVKDTYELRAWLRGFGEFVEVVKPDAMREAFADTARGYARKYLTPRRGARYRVAMTRPAAEASGHAPRAPLVLRRVRAISRP
jgi:predicted DNA-binding transcriptional regulator YafY